MKKINDNATLDQLNKELADYKEYVQHLQIILDGDLDWDLYQYSTFNLLDALDYIEEIEYMIQYVTSDFYGIMLNSWEAADTEDIDWDEPTKEPISYTNAMLREFGMSFGDGMYGSHQRTSPKYNGFNRNKDRK